MTPVFCCGAECGVSGTVGQHWSFDGANCTFSTSTVRSGARSLRVNRSAAATGIITSMTFSASAVYVIRFYIYFATLPSANTQLLSNSLVNGGIYFKSSDSSIYTGNKTLFSGSTGIPVIAGRWYKIDAKIDVTGPTETFDCKVDGVSCGQATNAGSGTITDIRLVNDVSSVTTDIYFDDFIISNTSGDYPIANGYVNHFVPTSDGTHTATTTTIVKGTIATPAGANVAGSTDVFNWVNGVPLLGGATDNTRLVNHQTAGTTLYAEVVFGPAPGILTPKYGPRAVEVITADREATTATGDFTTKINDNGTESNVIARGVVAGVITDRFATKQFATPPTGGSWGVASGAGNFNNLRARFGYASDATPDQYWRGIMVEAEFAEWPQKITQVKQAVNRSNNY